MKNSNNNNNNNVKYWPSTEPSIKRCTCVNKRKKAKQVHPVEDIGISAWPVDVVEFGADAYAHRKQVGVKQLYNQAPQTTWVSSRQWVPVAVRDRMPAESDPAPDRGLGPSETPGWAAQPECERSAAMVRGTWDQYVAVCPRLQLTSHTQPTSTL